MPVGKQKARRAPSARRPRDSEDVRRARRVLAIEARAIAAVAEKLDQRFDRAVEILQRCKGKVVVTGLGKSGLICRKIAATLTSTGTPAVFLHAAEAVHGDAGVFVRGDVVIALSTSGETEVVRLVPILKRLDLPLIAFTGRAGSTLGRAADVVLDAGVEEEACPMNLAPTASTTVALARGDALAVALLERKGFGPQDFAVLHPGGALGRRLMKVEELMHRGVDVPLVGLEASFRDTLMEISGKRLGITGVVDRHGDLVGAITDGDLRRAMERIDDIRSTRATDLMTHDPKTIPASALAERAVALMEGKITALFVLEDATRKPVGVIHLHDLLKAGVV